MGYSKKIAKPVKQAKKTKNNAGINEAIAKRVLEVVDAGLTDGVGEPVPGQMCVEAAVCYAMGEPHTDEPKCVEPFLREFKIVINDNDIWRNDKDRAYGLRRLAIAQLGTKGLLKDFDREMHVVLLTKWLPRILAEKAKIFTTIINMAAKLAKAPSNKRQQLGIILDDFINENDRLTLDVDLVDDKSTWMNDVIGELIPFDQWDEDLSPKKQYQLSKARQALLIEMCEDVVQVLVKLKTPGSKFLYLTEAPPAATI